MQSWQSVGLRISHLHNRVKGDAVIIIIFSKRHCILAWTMDNPSVLTSFCIFEILYCRGHHGETLDRWGDISVWIGLLAIRLFWGSKTACRCRDIPAIDRKTLFNRVFSHPDKDGKTYWSNVHEDPNYFQPNNTKQVPSLLMLSARQVRNQLIRNKNKNKLKLNKKHLSAKVMSTVVSKCMICAPHFMASKNPKIIFSVNRSIARTIYLPSLSGFCGLANQIYL